MTTLKHFFWLMLLPFVVGARDAYAAPKTSAQRFATMVQAIASIKAEEKDSNGNMSREAVIAVDNAKRVTTLIDTIEKLFEQKAFASFPGIKIQFYELFNKFPQLSWPSVSDVRHMRHDVTEFCSLFKQVLLLSSAKSTDRELLFNMSMLCNCLITNILQDDFFEFDLGQKAFDVCFNQPVEFMCEYPYLTIGSVIIIGGIVWLVVNKSSDQASGSKDSQIESELEKSYKDKGINLALIQGSQKGTDCGLKACYSAYCKQQAGDDENRFRELFQDEQLYADFAQVALEKGRQAGWLTQGRTGYFDGAELRSILDSLHGLGKNCPHCNDCNQKCGNADHKFYIKQTPRVFTTLDDLADAKISSVDIRYRDLEFDGDGYPLRDASGNLTKDDRGRERTGAIYLDPSAPILYKKDGKYIKDDKGNDTGEDRTGKIAEVVYRTGWKHDTDFTELARFNNGEPVTFIINTQLSPQLSAHPNREQQQALENRRQGHFWSLTAIKDSTARDGIRYQVADSMSPYEKVVEFARKGIAKLLAEDTKK